MTDEEFELFRSELLDLAGKYPFVVCPRCNGSGKRQGGATSCFLCAGKRIIDIDEADQYKQKAIFP